MLYCGRVKRGCVAQATLSRLHRADNMIVFIDGRRGRKGVGGNTRRLDCVSSVKPLKPTSIQERSVHSLA